MFFQEIALEEIEMDDETFRISEELDSESVLDSLREIGQLNPVILFDKNPMPVIVCGFRRVRAIRRLGTPQILARVLSKESCTPLHAFELALRDNLSHRQLNPLEKARVLSKLHNVYGISKDILREIYLPLLGLMSNENVLHGYLSLNGIQPSLRQCLIDEQLTHSSVEYLSGMTAKVQDSIASLMSRIRLSASLQRKVFTLLEELSEMAGSRLDAPLDNPEVWGILEDSRLSPHQKGEKLHDVLYRIRNPRLSKALEQFHAQQKRLELPGSVRITPHPFFETPDLRVEFHASTPEHFRQLAGALQRAAQSPELEELFNIV
jgi:hypothetical protein